MVKASYFVKLLTNECDNVKQISREAKKTPESEINEEQATSLPIGCCNYWIIYKFVYKF